MKSTSDSLSLNNQLLGELLDFVGDVGQALRVGTSFNPHRAHGNENDKAQFWLSDSIHSLSGLGHALITQDKSQINLMAKEQKEYWIRHLDEIDEAARINSHNNNPLIDIRKAVELMGRIEANSQ